MWRTLLFLTLPKRTWGTSNPCFVRWAGMASRSGQNSATLLRRLHKHSTRRDVSAVHLPYDNSHSVYPLLGYSRLAASKHDSRWLKHIEARNNQVRRLFMPQDNGRSVLGLSKIGHFSSFLPCFLSRLSMQIQLPWLWSSSFWEASQTHCLTPLSCKSKVSKGLVTSLIGKSMGNLKPCYHVRLFV